MKTSARPGVNKTVRSAPVASVATARSAPVARTNDPERTMADILEVASREFAAKGLSGARIDDIAARTRTSKRMIYYYFGSKEGLYLAVLEEAYRRMRSIEAGLQLDDLAPEEALRTLVGFTFDYQVGNPDFIRLLMTENIHHGEFLGRSKTVQELNAPAIDAVRSVYERGVASGAFRSGLDALDLHMSISALCFYTVSNRHTVSLIFKRNLGSAAVLAARRDNIVDMIVRYARN